MNATERHWLKSALVTNLSELVLEANWLTYYQ